MTKFYFRLLVAVVLLSGVSSSASADSVRKLKRQTFYGDAQGDLGNEASRKIDYLYDAQNRLIRTVEISMSTEYDASQRTWETTHYNKYEYDANGNLTQTTSLTYGLFDYGEWGYNESKDSVNYEYNELNQCVKETHKYIIYEYTYDEQGRKVTCSKWNINSITGVAKNDLVETYSDFNEQGNPCTITATSPTQKEWNEYTGKITYDEAGNKTSEIHWDMQGVMTVHETWAYDGDLMTEYINYNVLDGEDQGWTKETYAPVDGDKDKIMRTTTSSDGVIGGTDCLYEYDYYDGELFSPNLTATTSEEGINNVILTFSLNDKACWGNDFDVYRNGIRILQDLSLNSTFVYYEGDRPVCRVFDDSVKNGYYEYVIVFKENKGQDEQGDYILIDRNASNVAPLNVYTELPCATDLHIVSTRKDFNNNTYVTIGWTNPTYPEYLQYENTHLFFENMQTEEAATTDPTVTELEANFGPEKVKTVYVQTNYHYGRANSEMLTVDLDDYAAGITDVNDNDDDNIYNIAGQRVNENAKGILIKGGKKFVK